MSLINEVIEGLPVEVEEETLEQNPEFTKLLLELKQHILPSGVSKQVDIDLKQSEKELQFEKHPWLVNQILHSELEGLLLDYAMEDTETGSHSQDRQFFTILQDHFTRMQICDYLDCCPDPGTKVTLLGLTPDVVVEQSPHTQNLTYIEHGLIPLIEERLSKKCEKLLDYHNSIHEDTDKILSRSQSNQLPTMIETDRQKIQDEKQQLHRDLLRKDIQFKSYYKTLLESLHLLEELVSKYRLKNQSQHDTVTAEWLGMKFDGLCLKISVVELEVLIDTYTIETTKALRKIRDHLDGALSDVKKKCSQAQKLLETYESVGMGFDDMVKEYGRLREEVENKQWALSELEQSSGNKDN